MALMLASAVPSSLHGPMPSCTSATALHFVACRCLHAAATGVAVAGFYKMADRLGGKHVVIVVCGGNVSAEDRQQMYSVAGASAAAPQV